MAATSQASAHPPTAQCLGCPPTPQGEPGSLVTLLSLAALPGTRPRGLARKTVLFRAGRTVYILQGPLRVPMSGALLSPKARVVPLGKTVHSEARRVIGPLGLQDTGILGRLWPSLEFLEPCVLLGALGMQVGAWDTKSPRSETNSATVLLGDIRKVTFPL